MKNILEFIISDILYLFLPTIAFICLLNRLKLNKFFKKIEIIIFSLGIGPVLNLWLLNLLLLILPNQTSLFYILFLTLFNLLLTFLKDKKSNLFSPLSFSKLKILLKENRIISTLFGLFLIAFTLFNIFSISNVSIVGNDMLTYAEQGKIFARDKKIEYKHNYFSNITKFYYSAQHGFSFSLFSTENQLINQIFNTNKDHFFRSISNYYLLLITLLIFVELYLHLPKKYKNLSILGPIFLFLAPATNILMYSSSIDSFRIFLFITSLIFFITFIKTKNKKIILLLGITLGLTSNSHFIGLLSSLIIIFSFFLTKNNFKYKIKITAILFLLTVFFGAYHYPLQTFYGDGWILNRNNGTNLNIIEKSFRFISPQPKTNQSQGISPQPKTNQSQGISPQPKNINLNKKISEITGKNRDIDTIFKLFKNGYFGTFFRFNYIGILNIFFLIEIIFFIKNKYKLKTYESIGMIVYSILFIIIALKGYTNYRYALTLLPVTIFLTIFYSIKIIKKQKFKRSFIKKFIIIITIIATLNLGYTFKNDLIKYIYKYIPNQKKITSIQENTEKITDLIKTKSTSDLIDFLSNFNYLPNENFLTTGTRLVNYYTNLPTYFLSVSNKLYTSEGLVKLCTGNQEPQDTIKLLTQKYYIQYIIFRTTDTLEPSCFNDILTNQYSQKIFDSKTYQVYKFISL